MRRLVLGVAFLATLVLSANIVHAQSPYGVGGYLERPYAPDDDDGVQPSPESAADAARRLRRQRQNASDAQASQGTQSAQPQTTGATQGDASAQRQQRNQSNQATAPARAQNAPSPAPKPQAPAATAARQQQPAPPQRQQAPVAAQRQQEPGETRRATAPAPAATRLAERETADDDLPTPPVPLRRPQFADAPRLPQTAMAAPQPDTSEAAPAHSAPLPQGETLPAAEAASQAPPPSVPQVAAQDARQMPAGEQAGEATSAPVAPIGAPAANERPELATIPAQPAPAAETRPATRQESAATPSPVLEAIAPASPSAPVQQAAAEPGTSQTAADLSLPTMMAATEAGPIEPEKFEAVRNDDKPQPPSMGNVPASQPAPPPPAEIAAVSEAAKAVPDMPAEAPMEASPAISAASPGAAEALVTAQTKEPPAAASPAKPAHTTTMTNTTPLIPQPPTRQTGPLDKIIGQMLVVGFRGLTPEETWPQKLAAQIKAGAIGGVLFMSHNVQSPQQLKTLTGFLQRSKSDIPMLFAVDQEGGIVQRLSAEKGFQTYPTAGKIGQSNDPLTAYSVYRRLAAELAQNGFNLNLGPVVDLLRNDASPIIAGKERSFGSQPKHVAAFAKAFCIAHQDEGIVTALKHFPGHGSTPFDTHLQPVDVGASWDAAEMDPYRELIASKTAQAVMIGHIANPSMSDEPGLPASLSGKAIRGVLRGDLGFSGVVISDDLEMGAIRARYSIEESAVKAIKAGNDMIILSNQNAPNPDLPERVTTAIKKAVDAGILRREDLQASYDRILGLKQRLPGSTSPVANGRGSTSSGGKRASAERGKSSAR